MCFFKSLYQLANIFHHWRMDLTLYGQCGWWQPIFPRTMFPDNSGRAQEALLVVARFAERDIAELTDAERDELSHAALMVGFCLSRPLSEEESERLYEEVTEFFAWNAIVQGEQGIVYAKRRFRRHIPTVFQRTRRRMIRRRRWASTGAHVFTRRPALKGAANRVATMLALGRCG
jgi:hypothetical protein